MNSIGSTAGQLVDMVDYCMLPSQQHSYGSYNTVVSAQGNFSYTKTDKTKYVVLGILFGSQVTANLEGWEFTLGMRRWIANADDYPDYGDPKVQG